MKHIYLFTFTCVLFSIFGYSQPLLKGNQMVGYIISADGTKSEVGLEIEDETLPWTFQHDVRYFDKSLLTGKRIKRELKTVAIPGEIVEYGFGDRRFKAVTYNLSSKEGDILQSTLESIKGEAIKGFFAEVIHEGPITLMKFYLPPNIEDDEDPDALKSYVSTVSKSYDILIQRGNLTAKPIQNINVNSYFEDCPFVLQKFKEKKYPFNPSSGLKKLLSKSELSGIKLENAAKKVLQDFDTKCNS